MLETIASCTHDKHSHWPNCEWTKWNVIGGYKDSICARLHEIGNLNGRLCSRCRHHLLCSLCRWFSSRSLCSALNINPLTLLREYLLRNSSTVLINAREKNGKRDYGTPHRAHIRSRCADKAEIQLENEYYRMLQVRTELGSVHDLKFSIIEMWITLKITAIFSIIVCRCCCQYSVWT